MGVDFLAKENRTGLCYEAVVTDLFSGMKGVKDLDLSIYKGREPITIAASLRCHDLKWNVASGLVTAVQAKQI